MTKNFGKLILTLPEGPGQELILSQAVTTLGSADTNDIVIRQAQVSRAHARIDCSDNGCIIYDLGSSKGTLVNNLKVKQANLVSNDVIQLGEAILRFESLTAALETEATIFDDAIFETETPVGAAAAGEPEAAPASETRSALVEIQPGGARLPLFCVVARYEDISLFGNLAKRLGPEQPVYGLQPPRLAMGPSPFTKVEALASHYMALIQEVQAKGPYRLIGFNIGGIVALEVAKQLQSAGAEVSLLALLDTPYLAGNPLPYLNFRSAQYLNQLNNSFSGSFRGFLRSNPGQLLTKSVQAVKEGIHSQFPRVAQRLEEEYEAYQTTLADQAYALILKAVQSYKPQVYPGHIVLFLASESPVRFSGAMWGWHQIAPRGLDIRLLRGSYINILKEPHVQTLAEQLQAHLAL